MNIRNINLFAFLFTTAFLVYGQSWVELGDAIPGEAAYDYSSRDVSISSSGQRIAIGAERNDGNGINSGHVRIFEYDTANGWLQLGDDIDGEAAYDNFGTSVSLNSDGSIVAAGGKLNDASGTNSGHVRVYQFFNGSGWLQMGADIDGGQPDDHFGTSVSLNSDGTRVAIGARGPYGVQIGYVGVYEYDTINGWVQIGDNIVGQATLDEFGFSLMMNSDGSRIIIGAPFNDSNGDDSGQVQIYELDSGSNWIQLGNNLRGQELGDEFGYSVSMNLDGSIIAIGAPQNDNNGLNAGQVQVYEYNPGDGWLQIGDDLTGVQYSRFGYATSLDDLGSTLAVGAPLNSEIVAAAGNVGIYNYDETLGWSQLGQDIDGITNTQLLGQAVALNSNGTRIVIGAQRSGETTLQAGEASNFWFDEPLNINVLEKGEIDFYPNPTNGEIFLTEIVEKIIVYNLLGIKLLEGDGDNFSLNYLPSGIYFIELRIDNRSNIKRLVKI